MGKLYTTGEDIAINPRCVSVPEAVVTPPSATAAKAATVYVTVTSKKTAGGCDLDRSKLVPNSAAQLAGVKFAHVYRQQLEALIYNDLDKLDHNALTAIVNIYDIVGEVQRPIRLMSQKFHRKLSTVCQVINEFYNDNQHVIGSISQQLSGV